MNCGYSEILLRRKSRFFEVPLRTFCFRIAAVICGISIPLTIFAEPPKTSTRYLFRQPNASDAPTIRDGTPIDVLLGKASEHPISVMVGLKLNRDWIPEGYLSAAAVKDQRAAIEAAAAKFAEKYSDKKLDLRTFTPLRFVGITADVDLLQRLDLDDAITSIEFDSVGSPGLRQSAPLVNAPTAWTAGYTGAGQTVAIIDSGVDKTHPFLSGKVVSEACFSSSLTLCPSGVSPEIGPGAGVNCNVSITGCSHGTHVAGIAAGSSNADSIWGIARNANVISIQVMHRVDAPASCSPDTAPCARYFYSDLTNALNHVASIRSQFTIAAVNMSLQSQDFFSTRSQCGSADTLLRDAIVNLRSFGIAVVGITGNFSNKSALCLPGCIPGIIDVGASTKNDAVAGFSDSTSEFDLLAPGGNGNPVDTEDILSSVPGSTYAYDWGTSMAAPHVTGALALLRQKSPLASHDTLLQDLVSTGIPLTDPLTSPPVTKPRIDVWAALANADHTNPTAPTGLVAAAVSSTSISLSWNASSDEHGISRYSVRRRTSSSQPFTEVGTTVSTSYSDTLVSASTTYQYQVVALDTSNNTSAPSNSDLAATFVYSDDPLAAQATLIRSAHIDELRTAVTSIRSFAGLFAPTWTDPSLAGAVCKAIHIQELRDRLGEALTTLGISVPTYTDPTLTPGVTTIVTAHVDEIRRNTK